MIGAIIGDIVGSRFEFNNHLSKEFDFFHPSCEFTDDTVMTCAVAQALMDADGDWSTLEEKTVAAMQRIGRQFPNCGYGARFIHWMFSDNPQPYNSCGNGSAMRISPVGFAAKDVEEAKMLSAAVTRISHNHPEGMKGAEATAVAIVMARKGKSKTEIRKAMEEYYDLSMTVENYRTLWQGHGKEICQIAVPQALVCFFEGDHFEDVIRNCISIGGDSDTIAAIAGGIAEAYYGVPRKFEDQAKKVLDKQLRKIVVDFDNWRGRSRVCHDDYESLDEELKHDDCIAIPYPGSAYGWARIFYQPAEKRFFYDFYSTGVIDDTDTRYHGTEDLTVEQIRRQIKTKWPKNPKGIEVLNEILARDFPGFEPVEPYDDPND